MLQFLSIPFSKSIDLCVPQRFCCQTVFLSPADIHLKHSFPEPSAYSLCFKVTCSIIIWIHFRAQEHAQVFLLSIKSLKRLLGGEKMRDKGTLCSMLPVHLSSDTGNSSTTILMSCREAAVVPNSPWAEASFADTRPKESWLQHNSSSEGFVEGLTRNKAGQILPQWLQMRLRQKGLLASSPHIWERGEACLEAGCAWGELE